MNPKKRALITKSRQAFHNLLLAGPLSCVRQVQQKEKMDWWFGELKKDFWEGVGGRGVAPPPSLIHSGGVGEAVASPPVSGGQRQVVASFQVFA